MLKKIIVIAFILISVSGFSNDHDAVLDGGFWQLGPGILGQFSDEELAREVSYMNDLGMDIIMIQYSVMPIWQKGQEDYIAYVPNSVYPLHPAFQNRAPFESVLDAADKEDMQVYIGGMLIRKPFKENYREYVSNWCSIKALKFRLELIERFSAHPSFRGFYCPNEPNPAKLAQNGLDPEVLLRATKRVTSFLKSLKPDLEIVKAIGLYLEPDGKGGHEYASREYLDDFWRPFVSGLEDVDVWMVIDGVGTGLSNIKHTAMSQEWAMNLAHEYGKEYWTDVENARMGYVNGKYSAEPFPMSKLEKSLEVASRFAKRMVTFDYLHYMSRQSQKEKARALHRDYSRRLEKRR